MSASDETRARAMLATIAGYASGRERVASLDATIAGSVPDPVERARIALDNLDRLTSARGGRQVGTKGRAKARQAGKRVAVNGSFPTLPQGRIVAPSALLEAREALERARAMPHGPVRRDAIKRARARVHACECLLASVK